MTLNENKDHEFANQDLDDSIRENYEETHPIGTIITFECYGFTDKGEVVLVDILNKKNRCYY